MNRADVWHKNTSRHEQDTCAGETLSSGHLSLLSPKCPPRASAGKLASDLAGDVHFFFGRYGPRRLRLQLSVPTKLIETNKHKKTAVKQRSELLNYLLQHADFVSSGCSATRRKFLSATQQK